MRSRQAIFIEEFLHSENYFHALHLTRIYGSEANDFQGTKGANMIIAGPHGGAKSGMVDYILSGEKDTFKIQMIPVAPKSAFIGGQILKASENGQYKVNIVGSAADSKVACVDEIDKGSPLAISPLLGLMNEKQVIVGEVIPAKLETLYVTINASLSEMKIQFEKNDLGSLFAPLANRFQIKAIVWNWLDVSDQAVLDAGYADRSLQSNQNFL